MRDWPRLTTAQLQKVLTEVPLRAGTSLRFAADHETASADELKYATPQTQDEWQAGRDAAQRYLGMLKHELLGKTEGRGSTIFAIVGVLKFAEQHGMCTRREIEDAITSAGHSLDEGIGGRTLGEEISRQDQVAGAARQFDHASGHVAPHNAAGLARRASVTNARRTYGL